MRVSLRQETMCLQQAIDPFQPGLLLEVVFQVKSKLSDKELVGRVENVVRKHPALRQRFVFNGDSYHLTEDYPGEKIYCNIRQTHQDEPLLSSEREVISVTSEKLFQADVVIKDNGQRYLVFRVHHAIADLWSVGILVRDFMDGQLVSSNSEGKKNIEEPKVEVNTSYWRDLLSKYDEQVLPSSTLTQRQARTVSQTPLIIPKTVTTALQKLAADCGVTLYVVLLAAQSLALGKLCQTQNPFTAVTFHGRNRHNRNEVGYFANTLALPVEIPDCNIQEYIKSVSTRLDDVAKASSGAGYPELVKQLVGEDVKPVAPQSAVLLQQDMPAMPRGLAAALLGHGSLKNDDMALTVVEAPPAIGPFASSLVLTSYQGELRGRIEIDPFKCADWTGDALVHHLTDIFVGMVEKPDAHVNSISSGHNAIPESVEPPTASGTIVSTWRRQVEISPHKLAVVSEKQGLTYAELAQEVSRIASGLRNRGVSEGTNIAVLLPRNEELVSVLLAVMSCGATYVPLSDNYPNQLKRNILLKAQCDAVITDNSHMQVLEDLAPCWTISDLNSEPDSSPWSDYSRMESTAWLLFTSGSTGEPKGVAISHTSASNFLRWAAREYTSQDLQHTLAVTPLTFDLSIFEMFAPLTNGGCINIVSSVLSLIDEPKNFLQATCLNTVPSAAEALLQQEAIPETLRVLNLAGEPLNPKLAARLRKYLPSTRIYNLYGPTETTTYATGTEISCENQRVTIGTPLYGTSVSVVDENLRPVGVGVPGELLIYGQSVAQGYIDDPARCARSFLPTNDGQRCYRTGDRVRWLPDGNLDYIGRLDDQIKIRGYRIELGAIQTALQHISQVQESALIVIGEDMRRSLIAFVVLQECKKEESQALNQIKIQLQRVLPSWAIPEQFKVIDSFPRNEHGKLDRKRLRKIAFEENVLTPPHRNMNEIEIIVSRCWKLVINKEVNLNDNFIDIGGHSLALTKLTGLLRQEFDLHIPLYELWVRPTVAQQAKLISELMCSSSNMTASKIIPRIDRNISHS